ncbi:class I adenylate-forming enzyme family protein [Thalassorhabdomicrobium marinisediminis]|uniref:class I adenylate-forming enzyme family protein n=1 Tax=Thalassorhabdomicrobium marinisediminis TaxID=2170577 RepID=UPI002492AFEB|nr:class I adenylate-forming enzyme family protein [Thalassorhabdomicrobium marinisediminis]
METSPEIRTLQDLLHRNRRDHGDWISLVDPIDRNRIADGAAKRLTWDEVGARVDQVAFRFMSAGLGKGDVALLVAPTLHETLIAQMACLELGILVASIPVQYRENEVETLLKRLSPKAMIGHVRLGKHPTAKMLAEIAARSAEPPIVFGFGEGLPEGVTSLEDERPLTDTEQAELDAARSAADIGPDDPAFLVFTSGTSAQPKAIARTHAQTLISASFLNDVADLPPGGCFLSPRMLNTVGSLANGLASWLFSAAKMVLHQPFDIDVFLRQIVEERPCVTSCPPAILNMILQRIETGEPVDLAGLNYITSGSAQLNPALFTEFRERFGISLVNVYGSTEGAMLISSDKDIDDETIRADCFMRHPDGPDASCLQSLSGTRTRIVDPATDAEITEIGKLGELRLKGPGIMKGYWDDPEMTKDAFDADGWFRTGDLFRINGDTGRYLTFAGRLKNIIVRGGLNISAEEIQTLAVTHPAVLDAVAVSVPDTRLGEKVGLAVVLRPGAKLTLPELSAHLKDDRKVAIFKLPEYLVVLDKLPTMPSGKTDLKAVRAQVIDSISSLAEV